MTPVLKAYHMQRLTDRRATPQPAQYADAVVLHDKRNCQAVNEKFEVPYSLFHRRTALLYASYSTSVIGLRKLDRIFTGSGINECDVTPNHEKPLTCYLKKSIWRMTRVYVEFGKSYIWT